MGADQAGTRAERFYLRNGWLAKGHTERGEVVFIKELLRAGGDEAAN